MEPGAKARGSPRGGWGGVPLLFRPLESGEGPGGRCGAWGLRGGWPGTWWPAGVAAPEAAAVLPLASLVSKPERPPLLPTDVMVATDEPSDVKSVSHTYF